MEAGIVGLPNVGKSMLFNALTAAGVAAESYPFSTKEANVGAVAVPGLRSLLGTTLPSPMDMAVIAAGPGLPFLVNEATKARMHRFNG